VDLDLFRSSPLTGCVVSVVLLLTDGRAAARSIVLGPAGRSSEVSNETDSVAPGLVASIKRLNDNRRLKVVWSSLKDCPFGDYRLNAFRRGAALIR
jgi:hypothetical protein